MRRKKQQVKKLRVEVLRPSLIRIWLGGKDWHFWSQQDLHFGQLEE